MNILYIHTHDSGRYLQPYGYSIPMPNLMKFAREATVFRNAFCAGPTCSPSRAALLTGQTPHSCGMLGLAHRGFYMSDYKKHLASFLKRHGYETVLCGIQHEAPQAEMLGYSRILGSQTYNMGNIAFDGVKWDVDNAHRVADYLQKKHDKPFFLSFGMFNTHRRYPQHKAVQNPNYIMPPRTLYDTAENREDMANYLYSASIVDECIGIVQNALQQTPLLSDTLVLFTTDHGLALPNMKCNLYDDGIGVALILDFPHNKMRGKVSDALVSHLDVFPTICELCEITPPKELQGTSLLPILLGRTNRIRDHIFAEVNFHACYEPMRCVRTEQYKYICRFDQDLSLIPANIDDSPAKTLLVNHGLTKMAHPKECLFDLYYDPVERVNLVYDDRYVEIKRNLSDKLMRWMRETNDPLLQGAIHPPKGALLNRRSSLSAEEQLLPPVQN